MTVKRRQKDIWIEEWLSELCVFMYMSGRVDAMQEWCDYGAHSPDAKQDQLCSAGFYYFQYFPLVQINYLELCKFSTLGQNKDFLLIWVLLKEV